MTDAPRIAPIPFYFVRHGETDWNRDQLAQGRTDIPLNATGVEQAHRAAELLRGYTIATVCASPLQRARRTADIIRDTVGGSLEIIDDLAEVGFGEREGSPVDGWFAEWWAGAYVPEGAETMDAFMERALNGLNNALAFDAPVLVVAHGGIYRAIEKHLGSESMTTLTNGVPLYLRPPNRPEAPWTTSVVTSS